jgi:23S rRNA (uracil1939-C5)-methyltransferase
VGIQVEIEKLVYGGQGLGRAEGRVVLVPFVLPGEQVEAEALRETRSVVHARAQAWNSQSPERIEAPCPVFTRCGGCHYQHIPYLKQLEAKQEILRETLRRIGKIDWTGEIACVSGEAWGYRNRTQLRIDKTGPRPELGFFEAGSHRLVDVAECPVNSPALNRAHGLLQEMTRERRFPGFIREIELFTNEKDLQLNVLETEQPPARRFFDWCAERLEGFHHENSIDYPVGSDLFRVGSRAFFQVNRFLIEPLRDVTLGEVTGESALDLYAGVGLFTLPLARRFAKVTAVDASRRAVRDLQSNAERVHGAVRVVNLDVTEFLRGFSEPVDFVVADPPRVGLGPAVTQELLRLHAPSVALVSCDPATLGRDIAALRSGGYRLESVTLVDLFPQTFHLETVVHLRR